MFENDVFHGNHKYTIINQATELQIFSQSAYVNVCKCVKQSGEIKYGYYKVHDLYKPIRKFRICVSLKCCPSRLQPPKNTSTLDASCSTYVLKK